MLLGNILIFLLINYNNKDIKFGKIIVIYKINFGGELGDLMNFNIVIICCYIFEYF